MTSYYKMVSYGKAPEVLIWSVDPWVFYDDPAAYDERADAELYNEFLTKVLGVATDYEEPDRVELWKALAEPAYFQGNVDYFIKNHGQATVTDDDGNTIDFNPVTGDPYAQPSNIKRPDGSILYEPSFRNQTQDQILAQAAAACQTFNSVHMEGFDALGSTATAAFEAFINYAHSQGTTVILVLSPWHPYLYDYLLNETELHQGFLRWSHGFGSSAPCMASRCTAVMTRAAFPALRRWISLTGCTARIPALQSFSPALMRCWMRLNRIPCPTRWL